jgi:hypothetical protein
MGYSPFRQVGVTYHNSSKAFAGYTLFDNLAGDRTFLVDMAGEVVHNWPVPRAGLRTHSSYLLENGHLLAHYVADDAFWPGGSTVAAELDWSGRVVWKREDKSIHHAVRRLANGNTLILRWDWAASGIAEKLGIDSRVVADILTEVTPSGEVVWEWRADEHLDPSLDSTCPWHGKANGREWTHINSVEEMPDGNLLCSFRLTDTVAIVGRPSKKVLWRWGRGTIGHPHDASVLPNGNVLFFDNLWHFPKVLGWSRIVEVDPRTDKIVGEYYGRPKTSFFSGHLGSAQRLPNGNTLICEGASGRIFEVANREIVWEYVNPNTFARIHGPSDDDAAPWIVRARRYAADSPQLKRHSL